MEREYTEQEFRAILGGPVTEPEVVDKKIKEAYGKIRARAEADCSGETRRLKKRWIAAFGMAAAFVAAVCVCAANPTLAARIPLLGNIFKRQEETVSYPGDYSEHARQLVSEEQQEAGGADPRYSQTSGGVTVTISECCADSLAMYLGVTVEAKDGFSREMIACAKDTGSPYAVLQLDSDAVMAFSGDKKLVFDPGLGTRAADVMEGSFIDDSRFEGIIRIQLENRLGIDGDGNAAAVPALTEPFRYDLHLKSIYINQPASEKSLCMEGDWNFSLDVTPDDSRTVVKDVGLVNEDGVGVGTVRKSEYEISAQLLLPEGAYEGDYMMIMTDEKGQRLMPRDGLEDVCSVYRRDTKKVTITVWEQAVYEAHRNDAAYLAKHAAFTTEIDFTR